MPYHDRTKARLEHEVSILRKEVVRLRSKQEQRRRGQTDQAVLQARLEQQIHDLQAELENQRLKRKVRECGGGGGAEQNLNQRLQKLEGHVAKQECYIKFLEEQINRTRLKYQERMNHVHQSADQLEEKLKSVRQEMRTIKEQAGELDKLNKRVTCLSDRLRRRDKIIAHYEAQHTDFMKVIADLEKQVEQQVPESTNNSEPKIEDAVTEDVTCVTPPQVDDDPLQLKKLSFYRLSSALRMRSKHRVSGY